MATLLWWPTQTAEVRNLLEPQVSKNKFLYKKTLIIQFLSLHSQHQRPEPHSELSNSQALRELQVGFYFLLVESLSRVRPGYVMWQTGYRLGEGLGTKVVPSSWPNPWRMSRVNFNLNPVNFLNPWQSLDFSKKLCPPGRCLSQVWLHVRSIDWYAFGLDLVKGFVPVCPRLCLKGC